MKTAIITSAIAMALASGFANAGIQYDPDFAKKYAFEQAQANASQPSTQWKNWFKNCPEPWGDNTNFINQVIRAGLAKTASPKMVYYAGQAFNSDPRWQYSKTGQSPAWQGPQAFYDYVKVNNGGKIGMNFTAQTSTKRGSVLNFKQVAVGDIIFVDWENDNKIDHTMVVTGGSTGDYTTTLVSYQSNANVSPSRDKTLSSIEQQFGGNNIYHVFRPTQYNTY